ncbi:MAG: AAA family ATPase [Actinomycetota bacterium]|nr:AAA family ATPase [Actinomycetota bacterium]
MHAAEQKAQKTWNALDLAVSVASGTPWLGGLHVDTPGHVVVFLGEGGPGASVRRIRAICTSRGLTAEDLPITVCVRAPRLSDVGHMHMFAEHVAAMRPTLVILDPLYLSAGGANGADLYAMGALLERAQHVCAELGAALFVVTHYNRREGRGASRFTGAGPAEWGRVLIGAGVVSRHTDSSTLATTVLADLDVIGGEVPDQTFRVRRVIRAERPDDLDSPLQYDVAIVQNDDSVPVTDDTPPAARKLLEALAAQDAPATASQLVDFISERHGHGLRRETVSRHLNDLLKAGAVDCIDQGNGLAKLWTLAATGPVTTCDVTGDHLGDHRGVRGVTALYTVTPPDHTPLGHTGEVS